MTKYVLYSDTQIGTISYSGERTAAEVLEIMQRNEPQFDWHTIKELPRGHHTCKYCGEIVKGTNKDQLCDHCRHEFGHAFFSEL